MVELPRDTTEKQLVRTVDTVENQINWPQGWGLSNSRRKKYGSTTQLNSYEL